MTSVPKYCGIPAGPRLLVLAALILRSAIVCAQINAPGPATHVASSVSPKPHPSVCRIIVPEKDGVSFGSGTLIAVKDENALVITNWHVVRDAAEVVRVRFPDGFQSGARVLHADRDWDLAALLIWRPNGQPVPLATVAPQPGDPLTIAGYGFGDFRAVTGHCTQYVSPGVDLPFEMVEVSVEARQGDSGGPIFNQQGELAGVLFGASQGTTSGSYAGRIGQFLANISPELGRRLDTAVAQAARPPTPNIPASIGPATPESARRPGAADRFASRSTFDSATTTAPQVQSSATASKPARPSTVWSANNASPMNRTAFHTDHGSASETTFSLNWQALAGETPLEWAKSFFAAIGIVVVLSRLLRRAD